MNRQEAVLIVKTIAIPHRVKPDADLLRVWYQAALHDIDYEAALALVDTLNASSEFMPKPAQFNELKRRSMQPERQKSLPEPQPEFDPDVARAKLQETRKVLASVKGVEIPTLETEPTQ